MLKGTVAELKKNADKCAAPAEGPVIQNALNVPYPVPCLTCQVYKDHLLSSLALLEECFELMKIT